MLVEWFSAEFFCMWKTRTSRFKTIMPTYLILPPPSRQRRICMCSKNRSPARGFILRSIKCNQFFLYGRWWWLKFSTSYFLQYWKIYCTIALWKCFLSLSTFCWKLLSDIKKGISECNYCSVVIARFQKPQELTILHWFYQTFSSGFRKPDRITISSFTKHFLITLAAFRICWTCAIWAWEH